MNKKLEWRALSLTQPWAWIILHLGKRIENRGRNIGNHRGPLLLHASKRTTREEWADVFDFVRHYFGLSIASRIPEFDDERLVRGAIVGRCNVVDCIRPTDTKFGLDIALTAHGLDPRVQHKWYMGEHGYVLADVEPTPILPCAGALGFWRPPAAVVAELERKKPPTVCTAEGSTTTGDQPHG